MVNYLKYTLNITGHELDEILNKKSGLLGIALPKLLVVFYGLIFVLAAFVPVSYTHLVVRGLFSNSIRPAASSSFALSRRMTSGMLVWICLLYTSRCV